MASPAAESAHRVESALAGQLQLIVESPTNHDDSNNDNVDDDENDNDGTKTESEATLNRPMGVAISPVDGRLYVADSENCAVKIYSSTSSVYPRFKGAIYCRSTLRQFYRNNVV